MTDQHQPAPPTFTPITPASVPPQEPIPRLPTIATVATPASIATRYDAPASNLLNVLVQLQGVTLEIWIPSEGLSPHELEAVAAKVPGCTVGDVRGAVAGVRRG